MLSFVAAEASFTCSTPALNSSTVELALIEASDSIEAASSVSELQ